MARIYRYHRRRHGYRPRNIKLKPKETIFGLSFISGIYALQGDQFAILLSIIIVIIFITFFIIKKVEQHRLLKGIYETGLTPTQFKQAKKVISDFPGVYILYNENKKKYYVGQSRNTLSRVTQHFTGHGNGDVYADYKYGDKFLIGTINLADSGYYDLDKLEADTIKKYDAYNHGYNRTKGNGVR